MTYNRLVIIVELTSSRIPVIILILAIFGVYPVGKPVGKRPLGVGERPLGWKLGFGKLGWKIGKWKFWKGNTEI